MTSNPTERAEQLYQTLMAAIGYLDGNFIHAYSAAFHRIPRLRSTLTPDDFLGSAEVAEVTGAVIQLLTFRCEADPTLAPREEKLRASLEDIKGAWLTG